MYRWRDRCARAGETDEGRSLSTHKHFFFLSFLQSFFRFFLFGSAYF